MMRISWCIIIVHVILTKLVPTAPMTNIMPWVIIWLTMILVLNSIIILVRLIHTIRLLITILIIRNLRILLIWLRNSWRVIGIFGWLIINRTKILIFWILNLHLNLSWLIFWLLLDFLFLQNFCNLVSLISFSF